MDNGRVMHNGVGSINGQAYRASISFKDGLLKIGCIDISAEAARYILKEYDSHFPQNKEITLQ